MLEIRSFQQYQLGFNRAEMLRSNGQIAEAYHVYYDLLCYRIEKGNFQPGTPFSRNDFFIIDRLAGLSLLTGNKTAAKHLLIAIGHLTRKAGDTGMRIHAITKLLFVNLHDGLLDEAVVNMNSLSDLTGDITKIEISKEGLPSWEDKIYNRLNNEDRPGQLVCLYDVLGALSTALGRFEDGILLFQRAIQIGEKNRSLLVDSRLLSMKVIRTKALFQKGEINLAKKALEQIDMEYPAPGISSGIPIQILDLKSKIAFSRGELGSAYHFLLKIIQLCRTHRLLSAEINANFNLALTQIILNEVNEATDILNDCLVKAEKLGDESLAFRIKLFLKVADNRSRPKVPPLNYTSIRQKNIPQTGLRNEPITHPIIYRRSEDYMSFFEEKALLFQMQLAEGQSEKAVEILTQLRLLLSSCDSAFIHIRYQVLEFMLLYFTNADLSEPLIYEPLLDFLNINQLLPELWQFRRLLVHTNFVPHNQKAKWIEENQQLLDRITASLPENMQALYLLNKWSPNEEYLAGFSNGLFELKLKVKKSRFFLNRWLTGWKLTKELHSFQEYLKQYKDHLSRSVSTGSKPGRFDFSGFKTSALYKLLSQSKGNLSIAFLVLPDKIVIVSRSFLKIRFHTTYINRILLRQLVFSLRDYLYPAGTFRSMFEEFSSQELEPNDFKETLQQLGDILQIKEILEEHGSSIRHISFVADDVLHGFPFTLLELNGISLLDTMRVSISTDDYRPQRKPVSILGKRALIIGISDAYRELKALPTVLAEVKKISEDLRTGGAEVKILLNEKASLEEAKKHLQETDIAHFSCHGKFDFKHPDQSGLVLESGKVLTLRDVLSLEGLSQIKLLVLSSCRGAEHYILPGRWIIGLPETFCRAGVKVVVAFLWPVDDEFATCFTSRFYYHLSNHIPSEAFRLTIVDAKNKMLFGLSSEYWQPKFWAGAIYYEH